MAPTLTMYMGLPGSGKTTVAKARIKDNPNSIKRVNKDDLRAMMDAGHWSKGNEKFVLKIRDQIIREALSAGKHVICDDTNLHPKHEHQLRQIAKECDAGFHVNKAFLEEVSVEECIERDLKRTNSVGEKVIRDMYNAFLRPELPTYEPPPHAPEAILVDIDGTLAHMDGRRPYDWDRVREDKLDEEVATLVGALYKQYRVILLSGRDGACFNDTKLWLAQHAVPYHEIFMRAEGDMRKDTVVKKELFKQHIEDSYQVKFIIDDRPSVCRMWREEVGLKVLQVGDPHVEF